MDTSKHDFQALFQQLGLPHDEASRESFIQSHRPLPDAVRIWDAAFWSPAQATFLREAFDRDAAWAEIVDELDVLLRK